MNNLECAEVAGFVEKRTGAGLPLVMLVDSHEMIKVDDLTSDEVRQVFDEFRGSDAR